MTVKRVIFIRPGETDWNSSGRWQGWVASQLNTHGHQQAQALAKYVRNIGMSALYSSDLKRAVQTAEVLAESLGFAPVLDERWRERDIGKWQGMTLKEIREWYSEDYQALKADVYNYSVPGGESRLDVQKRVRAAFADILAEGKGDTVGVISHTTAIHTLLESLIEQYDIYGVHLGNTSVGTITRSEDVRWSVVAMNDLMHLEGLESRSVNELEEQEYDLGH